MSTKNRLRTAARGLGLRGFAVVPCRPKAKQPLTRHGCRDASSDPEQVADWWRRWPDANVAIATGPRSGIFVLDVDDEDGEASLHRLEAAHDPLPESVEVITGRGRHLYWRWPARGDIRNSAGALGTGLDIRGTGGYVLAPPSIHPIGRRYEWSADSAGQIAEAPPWLLERVASPSEGAKAASPEDWRRLICSGVAEGGRNQAVARLAGLLFRRLDPIAAAELVFAWNKTHCRPPLPAAEVKRTLDSIAGRELRRLGGAP